MGGKAPDPPDYGPLAKVQKKLGKKQLKLQEKTFAWTKDQAAHVAQIVDRVVNYSFEVAAKEGRLSDIQQRDYLQTYRPAMLDAFKQDIGRANTAYRQDQEQYEFAERQQKLNARYAAEDRNYLTDELRPLQRNIIRDERERQARDDKVRHNVIGTALAEQRRLQTESKDAQKYFEKEFLPHEEAFAEELRDYDTPERREEESARSIAEVGQSFQAERNNAERRLMGYGVDPSMVRGGALDLGTRIAEAGAQAQAGTSARLGVEARGLQAKQAAVDIGNTAAQRALGYSGASAQSGALASNTSVGGNPDADNAISGAMASGGAATGVLGMLAGMMGQTGYNQQYNPFAAGAGAAGAASAGRQGAAGVMGGASNAASGFLDTGSAAYARPAGYANAASGAFQGAAQTMHMGYQDQLAQHQANQSAWGNVGSVLGFLGGLPFGMAEGGPVDETMSPSGGQAVDDVPAALTAGEYVIPRDVVEWEGMKTITKMVERARRERKALPI